MNAMPNLTGRDTTISAYSVAHTFVELAFEGKPVSLSTVSLTTAALARLHEIIGFKGG